MNLEHKNSIKSPILVHGHNYARDVLTYTVKTGLWPVHLERMFTDGQSLLKPLWSDVDAAFVDGRHRYPAPQQLFKEHPSSAWLCSSLRVFLLTTPVGGPLSPLEVVLYGRTWNNLSDQTFLHTVCTMFTSAATFKIGYGTAFVTARMKENAKNLQAADFCMTKV